MVDIRLRSQLSDEAIKPMIGKLVTEKESAIRLTGAATVRKPNGQMLCVYIPKAIPEEILTETYGTLHSLKKFQTFNRGAASGTLRVRQYTGGRTYTKPISSAIIGAFDAKRPYPYCRLTAWTGEDLDRYKGLWPLFQCIADGFERYVPDRFGVQMKKARESQPEWVIKGTPFTTITVNNTYPTGLHTDAGDLPEGFGNLVVLRRGQYTGGIFTFPKYGVGVDMQDGDLLLCDVHEYHGNTALDLQSEDAERISIVAYFRRDVDSCGTFAQEADRARDFVWQKDAEDVGPDPATNS